MLSRFQERWELFAGLPRLVQGPNYKSKAEKVKYVDEGTIAVGIDLKHERTGHVLPPSNNLFYMEDTEKIIRE